MYFLNGIMIKGSRLDLLNVTLTGSLNYVLFCSFTFINVCIFV